jgi:hypothetical protein
MLAVADLVDVRKPLQVAAAFALFAACIAYAWWLNFSPYPLVPRPAYDGIEPTFNSMLEHMLHGQFDVDPASVGDEGYLRDGRIYAYWGIFPALLRLPLLLIPGGISRDMTTLSCLMAVMLAALMKLKTLQLIFGSASDSADHKLLLAILASTLLFSGAQIQFLRPSVYQEVCLWAGAWGSIFVYGAVRGLLAGVFSAETLVVMASAAGLALLTRVSTAIGMYAALGLLLFVLLIRRSSEYTRSPAGARRVSFLSRSGSREFLLPALMLIAFAGITALVNYERWGNPLVFADFHSHLMMSRDPQRLARIDEYGLFNAARIPFGINYFFFPIWLIARGDGKFLFEEYQTRIIDDTELPPGSFLLTDLLLMGLLFYALWSLAAVKKPMSVVRSQAIALGLGLTASCVLMLCAIGMCHRYRIDFYPFIELGAFIGLIQLQGSSIIHSRAFRCATVVAAAVSICASHLELILYKLSVYGLPFERIRGGLFHYYLQRLSELFPSLTA